MSVYSICSDVLGVEVKRCVTLVAEPLYCAVPEALWRKAGGVPEPLTLTALPPLVASDDTLIVPVKAPARVGLKVTLTWRFAPAAIVPLLQSPANPKGYVMPVTLSVALPVLAMVSTAVRVPPTGAPPKSKKAGTLMMRVATAVPVPLAAMVLAPEVALAPTAILPLKACALVGAKVTVMFVAAPAARPITPLLQLPRNPCGYVMLVTLSVELPELEMVKVRLVV